MKQLVVTNRQAVDIQQGIAIALQTATLPAKVFLRFRTNSEDLAENLKKVYEAIDKDHLTDEIKDYREKLKTLQSEKASEEAFKTLHEEYKEHIEKYNEASKPIMDDTYLGRLIFVDDVDFGDNFVFYDVLEKIRPIVRIKD